MTRQRNEQIANDINSVLDQRGVVKTNLIPHIGTPITIIAYIMPAPLSDSIIFSLARLVDDSQSDTREPSHSQLTFLINRANLNAGDPKAQGLTVGKAKRVTATLNWALEHNVSGGQSLVEAMVAYLRSCGGFRSSSSNFIGEQPFKNAVAAFDLEGFILSENGELHAKVLDNLSGVALTAALHKYVQRAQRGAADSALMAGTAKDLLEATAAHILVERNGSYPTGANFEALLGMAFVALGMVTSAHPVQHGEPWQLKIERGMFTQALGINGMRNKQGTGHGRPWLPTVTTVQAKIAVQSIGNIAEWLLHAHTTRP